MKKILALILTLCCVSALSLPIFAADNVAQVGSTGYSTLDAAVEAVNAKSGSDAVTLKLLADITLDTAKYNITRDNVTIDGDGKKITVTGSGAKDNLFTVTGANFNIKNIVLRSVSASDATKGGGGLGIVNNGSGTSVYDNIDLTYLTGTRHSAVFSGAGSEAAPLNLTIKNCTINSAHEKILTFKVGDNKVDIKCIDNYFNQDDSKGQKYGGSNDLKGTNLTVTIESGFNMVCSSGVYRMSLGTLNINGGMYYLPGNGEVIRGAISTDDGGGTVNVTDGVFVSKNNNASKMGVIYSAEGVANVTGGIFVATRKLEEKNVNYQAVVNGTTTVLAFPEGSTIAAMGTELTPKMDKGAALRIASGANSLAFSTAVSKSTADAISKLQTTLNIGKETTVTYGTLICTKASLTGVGGTALTLTHKDMANNPSAVYFDVKADKGIKTDADGNVSYAAAVVGVPEADLGTDFSARSYIHIAYGTAFEVYIYSDYVEADNVRNIKGVASAALADTNKTYNASEKDLFTSLAGAQ